MACALLYVRCDGSVKLEAWRNHVTDEGKPISDSFERLLPTRMILNRGPVLSPQNPDLDILFTRRHGRWAGDTLAFEARHDDRSTAVWRLPFTMMEHDVVDGFLFGSDCGSPERPEEWTPPWERAPEPETTEATEPPQAPTVKPVLIRSVQAKYTPTARKARIQGTVVLRTFISETGDVTEVEVLKRLPMGLSETAVEAVKQWKFRPATQAGKPVAVYWNVTVNFQLH